MIIKQFKTDHWELQRLVTEIHLDLLWLFAIIWSNMSLLSPLSIKDRINITAHSRSLIVFYLHQEQVVSQRWINQLRIVELYLPSVQLKMTQSIIISTRFWNIDTYQLKKSFTSSFSFESKAYAEIRITCSRRLVTCQSWVEADCKTIGITDWFSIKFESKIPP